MNDKFNGGETILINAAVGLNTSRDLFTYYSAAPGESTRYPMERDRQKTICHHTAASFLAEEKSFSENTCIANLPLYDPAVKEALQQMLDMPDGTQVQQMCDVLTLSQIILNNVITRVDLLKVFLSCVYYLIFYAHPFFN